MNTHPCKQKTFEKKILHESNVRKINYNEYLNTCQDNQIAHAIKNNISVNPTRQRW